MRFIKLTLCILITCLFIYSCNNGNGKTPNADSVSNAAPVSGPDAMPSPADSIAPVPLTPDSQNAANTEAANEATEAEKKMDGNKK